MYELYEKQSVVLCKPKEKLKDNVSQAAWFVHKATWKDLIKREKLFNLKTSTLEKSFFLFQKSRQTVGTLVMWDGAVGNRYNASHVSQNGSSGSQILTRILNQNLSQPAKRTLTDSATGH